MMIHNHRLRIT